MSHKSETQVKNSCELMHVDLMSSITSTEYNNYKYALIFTDDYFRVFILQIITSKNKVKKILVKVYIKI